MKHMLCVHLRQWPIDRLRRRRGALRHRPFVLVETVGTRQVVMHVTSDLLPHIYPGLSPAEVKSRNSDVLCLPATPVEDLRSLEALGRWLMKFSPNICTNPPCSIFLDATGLERLFGGLHNLHARVIEAFTTLRISAGVSIAPTPGAAWALAAYSPVPQLLVSKDRLREVLAPLPPQALRLSPRAVELLQTLGVSTVGHLLKLHREELLIRFGEQLLQRIDQALGDVEEPLNYLEHRVPIHAVLEFDGAVESLEAIFMAVHQLVEQVVGQMTCRGLGASEVRLTFRRPYASPVEKLIRLTRPSRNTPALCNLLRCALEMLETDEGFIAIELAVPAVQRLCHEQSSLIGGGEEHTAIELDRLIERLRARLDHAVEWAELVESHMPERAFRCIEASVSSAVAMEGQVGLFRPMRLLSEPRCVKVIVMPSEALDGKPVSFTDSETVHRLVHVHGPERITGEWWTRRWKTRDYFDALDTAGGRYWLFRVCGTSRWYLHGIFE